MIKVDFVYDRQICQALDMTMIEEEEHEYDEQ